MGKNGDLTNKLLTYKLTILLALTSASQVLGLQHLDIRFINKGTDNFIFTFGKPLPSLRVCTFEDDTKLYVAATLEEYLKRKKGWSGKDKRQLLLIFDKLHNPVVSSTISGWIKNVLNEEDIDNEIFKGHSTRST